MKLTGSELLLVDDDAFLQQREWMVTYKQPQNKCVHRMGWGVQRHIWTLKYIMQDFLAMVKSRFIKSFKHREYRFIKEMERTSPEGADVFKGGLAMEST